MGNPARKTSKAKRDSRKAQTFKLSLPGIVECPQCHEMKLAHRVCKVVDITMAKKLYQTINNYKKGSRKAFFFLVKEKYLAYTLY